MSERPRRFDRHVMYRTFLDEYSETWGDFCRFRRKDGILEVRFHWDDGPWKWNMEIHRALIPLFADLAHDPDTECIILTGTGDTRLSEFDQESWVRTHTSEREGEPFVMGQRIVYDMWYISATQVPLAVMDIKVPIIAAVNGPCLIHPEIALLSDLVLCSENAYFSDRHYTAGIVPGDQAHILFRELLGKNRSRYFLLTGARIEAQEALELGMVGEIVPRDTLLDRAWELAEKTFMTVNRINRRMTRSVLIQPWRELYMNEIAFGIAHQAWASQDSWPGAGSPHETPKERH